MLSFNFSLPLSLSLAFMRSRFLSLAFNPSRLLLLTLTDTHINGHMLMDLTGIFYGSDGFLWTDTLADLFIFLFALGH